MSIEMPRLDGKISPSEDVSKTSSGKNSNILRAKVKKIALSFLIVGAALIAGGCGIMGCEDVLVHVGSFLPVSVMDFGTAILIGGFAAVATGIAYSVKKHLEIKKQMKEETIDEVVEELLDAVLEVDEVETGCATASFETQKRVEKRGKMEGVFKNKLNLEGSYVEKIIRTFFPEGVESFSFDETTKKFEIKLHKEMKGKVLSKGWDITKGARLTVGDCITGQIGSNGKNLLFDKGCISVDNRVETSFFWGRIGITADVVADLRRIEVIKSFRMKLYVDIFSFKNGLVNGKEINSIDNIKALGVPVDRARFYEKQFVDSFGNISW